MSFALWHQSLKVCAQGCSQELRNAEEAVQGFCCALLVVHGHPLAAGGQLKIPALDYRPAPSLTLVFHRT